MLLGDNADLYTLVGRGDGAVRELLQPLASTENAANAKASEQLRGFRDLKRGSMEGLARLQVLAKGVPDSFVGPASFIARSFPTLASKHAQKWFKLSSTSTLEREARGYVVELLLKGTLSSAKKANASASETLAVFRTVQARLNEMAHLDRTLLPDTDLYKLSRKSYWKKSLKAFQHEDPLEGFSRAVEELAEYHSHVAMTIAFVSELRETFDGLIFQLEKLLADLEHLPLLSGESGGPAASLDFYGDLLGRAADEINRNGEKMAEVGRNRVAAVQMVVVE